MPGITLTEASYLTSNPMKKGIIQTIARESAVLEVLPFETILVLRMALSVKKQTVVQLFVQ